MVAKTAALLFAVVAVAHGVRLTNFKRSRSATAQMVTMKVKNDLKIDASVAHQNTVLAKEFDSLLETGDKSASIVTYEDEAETPELPHPKEDAILNTGLALRSVAVPTNGAAPLTARHHVQAARRHAKDLAPVSSYVNLMETASAVHPHFKKAHAKYQEIFQDNFPQGPTATMDQEKIDSFKPLSQPTPLFGGFKAEEPTILVPVPVSFLQTYQEEKPHASPVEAATRFMSTNEYQQPMMQGASPFAGATAYPAMNPAGYVNPQAMLMTGQQGMMAAPAAGLYAGGLQAPPPPPRPDNLPPPPYIRPVPQPEGGGEA